jgi:TonB family protein
MVLLGGLFATDCMTAQSDTTIPGAEQQKAEREYAEILARVQQGDMTVDFRAFRVAGALKSGPHASKVETEERAAFRNIMAASDWAGALNSAKRALQRDYASPIAQYDAMAAYQALGKTDEAAAHEKILNALLDSIRQSGDGKSPDTAYFVVTVQEEYIFLNRVLHVRATSQAWVRKDGHFYDRLSVPDSTTNQVQYLWFNADSDARNDPVAMAATKDGILAVATATGAGAASTSPPAASGVPPQPGAATHPEGYVRISNKQIRVRNGSDVDFKDVAVGGKKYGDIKAGATTGYQEVWELASRYAAVSLFAGSQPMTITPSGERTSGDGLSRLTYVLTFRGGQLNIGVEKEAAPAPPGAPGVPLQPRSPYVFPSPPAYTPDPNVRAPANTTILDNFNGSSAGHAFGIEFTELSGAQPSGRVASFSRKSDSRIEYLQGIPSEGTLELWINVTSGYAYDNFHLQDNQDQALIFSTDSHGGDVTWPGAAKLFVSANGDVSLFIAASRYNQPPAPSTEAKGTPFRFNSWHAIGVSYGSQGELIMVDGRVVASASTQTQTLGAAGSHQAPLDIPTIGETVSHYWAPHRYDGGFNGTVAMFRASSAQDDWYLARGVTFAFRQPTLSSTATPQTSEEIPGQPGVYHIGGGVTAPVPLYRPEPEYPEKARRAKYQGTVILYVEVDTTGRPRNIKVTRKLGHGLDEKATEAVEKWRFRPGYKDGKPVTVAATAEVNFRLLKDQ